MIASNHIRLDLLRTMLRIRSYERELALLAESAESVACTSMGQEACAVGVVTALEPRDRILTNHRSAGHLLARGAQPFRMFAEVLGRREGYCKGKGGALHMSVKDLGIVLTSAIPGGELSMVTGVALAQKLGCGEPRGIVVVFFGDGAACEGIFHESLNLATTWHLPILYVCENNQWQGLVHRSEAMRTEHISVWAQKFDLPAVVVDGNDVEAVHTATVEAATHIRRTGRPYFMELQTYRVRGHVEPYGPTILDSDERRHWRRRDPITCMHDRLLRTQAIDQTELDELASQVDTEIVEALRGARGSQAASSTELLTDVYA